MTNASVPGERGVATRLAWLAAGLASAVAAGAITLAPGAPVQWAVVGMPMLLAVPGALIVGHSPRHLVGWLLLFVAGCFGGTAVATLWLASGREAAAAWAVWWVERGSAVLVPATVLIVLLLPDGRLPSRRWRPLAAAVVGIQALVVIAWCMAPGTTRPNPVGVLPDEWAAVVERLEWVLVVPFALSAVAVAHRLVAHRESERRRLCVVLGGVLVFAVTVTLPGLLLPGSADWFNLLGAAVLSGTVLIAALSGQVAHVRVVVSQTLVYVALTGLILTAHAAVVVLARVNAPPVIAGAITSVVALGLLPVCHALQGALRRAIHGEGAEPHRALRRLTEEVDDADDIDGVLAGVARTTAASLRARWVEVSFDGRAVRSGTVKGDETVHARALPTGHDSAGELRVGLPPGRRLADAESALLDDLAEQGSRAARVVSLAAHLAAARVRLVESREEERSRLRRNLHDDLGPVLAGLTMQLGSLPDLILDDSELARDRLSRLEEEARGALDRMREITKDLRPPALDELGLPAAVRDAGDRLGVEVHVDDRVPRPLPAAVEVALYRVAVEAVLNASRHAGVERVEVVVRRTGDQLELVVRDHGSGTCGMRPGVGIHGMRERAEELGGSLAVTPTPGGGTTVRLTVPDAAATRALG